MKLSQLHTELHRCDAVRGSKAMGIAVIYSMRSQVRVVVIPSPVGGAVNISRLPENLKYRIPSVTLSGIRWPCRWWVMEPWVWLTVKVP